MVRRKDIDGSESVPTFYGKELRWKREEAGLTLHQLVEGSFYGQSHLGEIERGERRMPRELAQHVDRALKTDGFFERRCEDVRKARWRKSTYSNGGGGNCVEVAPGHPGAIPVRDSKSHNGPVLLIGPAAWSAFLSKLKGDWKVWDT